MANAKERIEQDKQQALLDIRSEVIKLSTLIAGKIVNQKLNSDKDQTLVANTADEVLSKH
ncbi:hypothetical protein SDC9_106450 [bioreactor metagenome]|uniref:ATP synthase subunit b n=1 Tax=bioreactor metagenome TaxID=1076179 RepID=A0A645B2E3_9ZZZZ